MRAVVAVLALMIFGCSSSASKAPAAGGGSAGSAAAAGGGDTGSAGSPSAGMASMLDTVVMPLINHKTPAFGSDGPESFRGPQDANDGDKDTAWEPHAMPAWIAFDVSSAPQERRGQVLLVWNALHAGGWVGGGIGSSDERPVDYTIEVNAAASGSDAPTDGWMQVAKVTDCQRGSFQQLVDLAGGNWVRMSVTKGTSTPAAFAIDVDIFSAPNGDSDGWLFMGDSITNLSTGYASSDLPSLVQAIKPDRFPPMINAAIGGTNTGTAINIIDDTIGDFAGRFVTLNYGTNDHPDAFAMEPLVQRVIAAGKVPVVPHMPWSQGGAADGENINTQIDALYAKYPEILHGPDMYAVFKGHTEWIPATDVHPNAAGQEQWRKAWATVIAAIP
jgi:lysophospholipase L1-like esterase